MAKHRNADYTLSETLDHCEAVVRTKVGGGNNLGKAYHSDRWARHFRESRVTNAEDFNQRVYATLAATVFDDDPKKVRLEAVTSAFSYVRAMAPSWAITPDAPLVGKNMVYKLYGEFGALLYVGITDRGPTRLSEHYRHKPWFNEVARVEFERYDSRRESSAREVELITSLAPLYNIQHNRGA